MRRARLAAEDISHLSTNDRKILASADRLAPMQAVRGFSPALAGRQEDGTEPKHDGDILVMISMARIHAT
jgi:hypothetical protein